MKEISVEQMWARFPLMRFSPYSQMQASAVCGLATEILNDFEVLFVQQQTKAFDPAVVARLQNRFWLLILGSYEVVRTMSQHGSCFSESFASSIRDFKRRLARVRVPFAKQEARSTGRSLGADLAIHAIDPNARDVIYEIEGDLISVRETCESVIGFFKGIRLEDVNSDIRDAQRAQARGKVAP